MQVERIPYQERAAAHAVRLPIAQRLPIPAVEERSGTEVDSCGRGKRLPNQFAGSALGLRQAVLQRKIAQLPGLIRHKISHIAAASGVEGIAAATGEGIHPGVGHLLMLTPTHPVILQHPQGIADKQHPTVILHNRPILRKEIVVARRKILDQRIAKLGESC